MLYIAENLKSLRKEKELTQEEVAELLGVSSQSVSKWERGDTYPDITLLPSLANLYKTSVDALIGMNKINDEQAKEAIFNKSHEYFQSKDYKEAVKILREALKIYPNCEGIMSELAIALALNGDTVELLQATTLCERILSGKSSQKVHHTTRAALCFIHHKIGQKEKAIMTAKNLPHIRESRETILKQLENQPKTESIDAYLRFIVIGEDEQQEIITIDFGINMVPICSEHSLTKKIESLRNEMRTQDRKDRLYKLPIIRVRDNVSLMPNQIRVRYYSDFILDKEFTDCVEATNEVVAIIRDLAQKE